MNPALWISKTGLAAQDAKMTAISNNLANVNTTGFKRDRAMFADLFYQNQRTPGGQARSEQYRADRHSVRHRGEDRRDAERVYRRQHPEHRANLRRGDHRARVLPVETADGDIAYTRAGNFQKTPDGVLTNAQGLPLVPQIELPENVKDLQIGKDGTITATVAGETDPVEPGAVDAGELRQSGRSGGDRRQLIP